MLSINCKKDYVRNAAPAVGQAHVRSVQNVTSIGAVILDNQQRVLLMFQAENRYWEFPKGKVEKWETEETQTLKREIAEETGLSKIRIMRQFKETINYQFIFKGFLIKKKNIFYLAFSDNTDITLSSEHLEYKWVSLRAAGRYLKHKNQRILLYKIRDYLKVHKNLYAEKMASK